MNDSAKQTPMQEAAERLAEHAAARTVPFLVGVEDLRQRFADYRQRTRDDHALNTKLLGGETGQLEPEEMGDINVSGDKTEYHYHVPEPKPAEAGKEAPSLARKLLPLAMAAGLGAGGAWLWSAWDNFQWPGVPDTEYEIRFYNSDNELIQIPRHGTAANPTD